MIDDIVHGNVKGQGYNILLIYILFSEYQLNAPSGHVKIDRIFLFVILARFQSMLACPDTYYITVLEDVTTNKVIGTTTTVIEQKFIHSTSKVS